MADSEFDWTFDDIPAEETAEIGRAERSPAPPPRRPAPPPRAAPPVTKASPPKPKKSRRWRLAALLLTPLVVAGVAAYIVYAVGWARVRAQLTREITYEDQQSLAGNINAVMALQAFGNDAWQRRRTAEVAAGLAAPRPAASLAPLGAPPEVARVDAFGERLFTSTVIRQYADSTGQAYRFRYTQRYFNNGPGLWQRLPPDEARLAQTQVWTGRRMAVTYPEADAAWMETALPQIDDYLSQACNHWVCPTDLSLPVLFSGELDDLARPLPASPKNSYPGGYPVIFDTTFRAPRYPPLIIFASPQLAGVPDDEAASQALVRALTSDLLGQLAAEMAGTNRAQAQVFLDALVARAEMRLGISTPPVPQPTLPDYLPVAALWRGQAGNVGWSQPEVAPRLEALWFLNEALGDRSTAADAALLATLNRANDLAGWLAAGAQLDGAGAIARWEAATTSQLATAAPADWSLLEGLAYTCGGSGWLVRAHGPQLLPQEEGLSWLGPISVSPDGVHIAAPAVLSGTGQLRLVDMTGLTATVMMNHDAYPLGWAANGDLVVVDQAPAENGRVVNRLRVYNVAGGFTPVTGMEVAAHTFPPVWSTNREALAFTLTDEAGSLIARTLPAIVAFDDPFSLLVAAWQGTSPTLSPDGRWLAYITSQAQGSLRIAPAETRVEMLDLETQISYPVLTLADFLNGERIIDQISALSWSPDGKQVAVIASEGTNEYLYLVTLSPQAPNAIESMREVPIPTGNMELIGFSSDGQYLAISSLSHLAPRLMVLDLNDAGARIFAANADRATWSATGHRLAIANAAGLYVAEPETGVVQWLTGGDCTPSWYALPTN